MKFFGGVVPIQLFLVLIPLAAAVLVVRKTPFGIYIEACGDNLDAAKNQGYVLFFYTVTAYVICNLLTAMAGIFDAGKRVQRRSYGFGDFDGDGRNCGNSNRRDFDNRRKAEFCGHGFWCIYFTDYYHYD